MFKYNGHLHKLKLPEHWIFNGLQLLFMILCEC